MKRILCRIFCLSLALGCLCASTASAAASAPASSAFTFFKGTQYPLTVHVLKGEKPGPTVMVQGGIQGDESSGFITAQILTRAKVKNGTLFIVPRANVPTVNVRRRQINVDLNRRFDQDYSNYFEDSLARAIRFLLDRCDGLIHLHEGSGFYRPTYEDVLRNPKKYGQSIIIDTPVFENKIHLADKANAVLKDLNKGIPHSYRFTLFNTNTFKHATHHKEQRKSLTYYALTHRGIPALAIEVSKDIIQLGWKVKQQLRATKLMLHQYGVEVELPRVTEKEIESYARSGKLVSINGQEFPTTGTATLRVSSNGQLRIEPAGINPDWGTVPAVFASDRPGVNMLSMPRLALSGFQTLDLRGDGRRIGKVRLHWDGKNSSIPEPTKLPLFVCWLNKKLHFIPVNGVLDAVEGDQLVIEGIWGGGARAGREEILNLKGIVSQVGANSGQDAGYEIVLDSKAFLPRYVDKANGLCEARLVRETPGFIRRSCLVRIHPREVKALQLASVGSASSVSPLIQWEAGETSSLRAGQYRVSSVWSNGDTNKLIFTLDDSLIPWEGAFSLTKGSPIRLTLRQATTFRPLGTMKFIAE
ncbi:M99 family carboxypeptidase catalytic domain-containing protein [Desulfobaculum bizertense]|uniref:Carboxypeptidase controlling helical cell shape n=1 Tax=Desulfobaculum bizertense DSM 18034 TaxID=1121442 RepID=A0A1T4WBZ4_9BACT|nr:M99 family carboxypeptidase catalytic domain-containing protein [Desulfobaculum bizertense]SKA74717.1 Carboxypeptidase controlling helical cell shape [Desulfobaculum bizertense DSM 18034]